MAQGPSWAGPSVWSPSPVVFQLFRQPGAGSICWQSLPYPSSLLLFLLGLQGTCSGQHPLPRLVRDPCPKPRHLAHPGCSGSFCLSLFLPQLREASPPDHDAEGQAHLPTGKTHRSSSAKRGKEKLPARVTKSFRAGAPQTATLVVPPARPTTSRSTDHSEERHLSI